MPYRSFWTRVGVVFAGLLALPLAVTTAGPAAAHTPAGAPTDQDLRAALRGVVAAGASGISLRVDDGHGTARLAAGAARLDPRVQMRTEARVRVGSITKTFVSIVVLQLVGEHRLSLDDTVERWLPGLVPDGDGITLRQLLNHTSGIFDYTADEAFNTALFADPLREYTPRELVRIATTHPPLFAPGTSGSYSNTNYVILGLVLERVTHRPAIAVLRQRIIDPLGLHDTYLPVRDPNIRGYHAHGYVPTSLSDQIPPPRGGPNRYVDVTLLSPTAAWTAGALISTPDDLRAFYRALLGGRLLRPAQLAEMKTMVELGSGFGYGLGLYTMPTPCGQIWGHDGGVPGYETTAWNDETGRRGFVLALPTQPDAAIGVAAETATIAATCRMLGKPVPATTASKKARPAIPSLASASRS
jgi:D-alanyl-D-alanine carboxypeptidase